MVEVELDQTDEWGEDRDWQALADAAVAQAFVVAGFATNANVSISITLSNNDEVQALNAQWRDKNKPTNVLSFPMLEAEDLAALAATGKGVALLGDIILAHMVCVAEAEEKGIALPDHVTHLIIHGTLHLLGHDHIDDIQAEHMEALEVKALASLGLGNPYSDN
ncbi:MAG: rRNA maturation RNase YbeY [Sphingorhabdus sp.]